MCMQACTVGVVYGVSIMNCWYSVCDVGDSVCAQMGACSPHVRVH